MTQPINSDPSAITKLFQLEYEMQNLTPGTLQYEIDEKVKQDLLNSIMDHGDPSSTSEANTQNL